MRRKIAVVTGTRAEYGYLKPVMTAIEGKPRLELIPVVTGMHLMKKFGFTHNEIKADFKNVHEVKMLLRGSENTDMGYYMAKGVKNFTTFLSKKRPDIVVVLGDRIEPLAVSAVCLFLNIPLAHINGGDVTGTIIDESMRHAITKMAHIHFTFTPRNAERVIRMGEDKWRVFVVGSPSLDTILNINLLKREEIFEQYDLDPSKETILVLQHPVTTLKDNGVSQFKETIRALGKLKRQTIMLYPNCDAGWQKFVEIIEKHKGKGYVSIVKNMPHPHFISFMKNVDVMVGNSSAGIMEAPSLKTPVVNIGSRQQGRERSRNILDVKPNKKDIVKAVGYAMHNVGFRKKVQKCRNKFGDGKASDRIVSVLESISLKDKLIKKQITY